MHTPKAGSSPSSELPSGSPEAAGSSASRVSPPTFKALDGGFDGRSHLIDDAPPQAVPPTNTEVEAALLGILLRNNEDVDRIADRVTAEEFSDPGHQKLFDTIRRTVESGRTADPLTLRSFADNDADLTTRGGSRYLRELVANLAFARRVDHYADLIRDLFLKRRLMSIGSGMFEDATSNDDPNQTAESLIEGAERSLYELATAGSDGRQVTSLSQAMAVAHDEAVAARQKGGNVAGVTTGLQDIDRVLGGLHPADLIVIAGRPSMGKSAMATTIALNAARRFRTWEDASGRTRKEGGRVLIFSLEMASEQIALRLMANEARVPSNRIRRGLISDQEFENVGNAIKALDEMPVWIDDSPYLSVNAIRRRSRQHQRRFGCDLLIIDYLQLLHSASRSNTDNRVQEVSQITRSLKELARELSIPVVALSQLSRAPEQRDDKRPLLSDLRESGSIEQDADVVAFLYREEYYLQREQPERKSGESDDRFRTRQEKYIERMKMARGVAEFIIAKQRHGPVSAVELFFDGEHTTFTDLARINPEG